MGSNLDIKLPDAERQIRPLLTCLEHDGERLHVWQEVAKAGEKITAELVQRKVDEFKAAADWIDANQLGRRNLTPDQHTLLLGRRYNRVKKRQGGTGANQYVQTDQNDPPASTAEKLAQQHGVSPATVKRAGQYADAVDTLAKALPDLAPVAAPRQAVIKAAALLEKDKERAESIISGTKSLADVTRETKRAELVERLESVAAIEAKVAQGVLPYP